MLLLTQRREEGEHWKRCYLKDVLRDKVDVPPAVKIQRASSSVVVPRRDAAL